MNKKKNFIAGLFLLPEPEPGRAGAAVVQAVDAFLQAQPVLKAGHIRGGDAAFIFRGEAVQQVSTGRREMPENILPVSVSLGSIQHMVAAHIQDQVIISFIKLRTADIPGDQPEVQSGLFGFAAGLPDSFGDKIDPGHLPALLAHRQQVGAGAAPEVHGPARWVAVEEFHQFRRRDPTVPGRFFEIQQAEEEPATEFLDGLEHAWILPEAGLVRGIAIQAVEGLAAGLPTKRQPSPGWRFQKPVNHGAI